MENTSSGESRLDMLRHGYFQAAYFYHQGMSFVAKDDCKGWTALHPDSVEPERILESIGVFYDYSSIPQDKSSGRLVEVLRHLHNLISMSTMLILRRIGDSYEERAWCALELSVSPALDRMQCLQRIVLRMDRIGNAITQDELAQTTESPGLAASLIDSIDSETSVRNTVISIAVHYEMTLDALEDGRSCPLFTTRRAPNLFKGHKNLLWTAYSLVKRASNAFEKNPSFRIPVEDIVQAAVGSAGLRTSCPSDIVYIGHMILYQRFRGDAQLARLFSASLDRFLEGKSTVLSQLTIEESSPVAGMAPSKVSFAFEDLPRSAGTDPGEQGDALDGDSPMLRPRQ